MYRIKYARTYPGKLKTCMASSYIDIDAFMRFGIESHSLSRLSTSIPCQWIAPLVCLRDIAALKDDRNPSLFFRGHPKHALLVTNLDKGQVKVLIPMCSTAVYIVLAR